MKVRIIQWFTDTAAGMGDSFRPKDVLNCPDEKLAKKWITQGLAVSIEPAETVVQKIKKSVSK